MPNCSICRVMNTSLRQAQHVAAQAEPPVAGPAHLLLDQFVIGVVAAFGEEFLAVAHLEPPFHLESLAVGVALEHQKRRVRRHDVVLFA